MKKLRIGTDKRKTYEVPSSGILKSFHFEMVKLDITKLRLRLPQNLTCRPKIGTNLSELGPGFLFFHPSVQDQVIEDFAAAGVLHHEVQRLFSLNHLKQKKHYGKKCRVIWANQHG